MLRINSYNYGSIYRYGRTNGYRRYSNLYSTGHTGTSFSKTLQRTSQYNNVNNYNNSGLDLTNIKKEAAELAASANKLTNLSKLDENMSYKSVAGSQQFDYSRFLYGNNGSYYQSMLYSSLFSGLGFNGYF